MSKPIMDIQFGRQDDAFLLTASAWLPHRPDSLFPFFADACNLEIITPPFLHFQVITDSPIEMKAGTVIDYRLRLHGIPLRWTSQITEWSPPHRFVDEQLAGPYRKWRHEHTFEPGGTGTLMHDRVEYKMLGGWLVNRLLVRRDLFKIFSYRRRRLESLFMPGVSCSDSLVRSASGKAPVDPRDDTPQERNRAPRLAEKPVAEK